MASSEPLGRTPHLKLELQEHSSDLKEPFWACLPFEVQRDILGCSLWLEARKEALEVETEKCEMGSPRGFFAKGPPQEEQQRRQH